ncbi:M64 family metallopeptidase [Dysgonomonas sp. 25]|uniref:M64 family metallopeptidase n=1 Tax=Dysgonomonas sp. 25 TaxID=2302933 RepID=UPI0013D28BDA|nr:M64 family metallopeptidase [Dysgonomonas sp. 25]NDV68885.1 peptidase M64 [Dysgonomonas sp. 25]
MKYYIAIILLLGSFVHVTAQKFSDNFETKTLRLDYIFTGTSGTQDVALDGMSRLPGWAGRWNNLDSLALKGNGQVIVTDAASGKVIYKDAFSTLFQEWQITEEAQTVKRSFENVFLVPYPKNKVYVEIKLRDRQGNYHSKIKHLVDPQDILIKEKGQSIAHKYTYTHHAITAKLGIIHVAILAEGYTAEEMPLFREHARIATERILAHTPFGKHQDKITFVAVETTSEDTDVSVPRKGIWKSTAFGSHFDTFYSERYLTTTNVKKIHDAIAGIPYSHIIILANTHTYGGGGIFNAYTLTTTGHPEFAPVVVHEFGHSFGGLADEYYYEGDIGEGTYALDVEPWEQNITTLVDFSSKWKALLPAGTPVPTPAGSKNDYPVGVYEGGGYSAEGIYRPAFDCRMRTNTCKDFCPACQKALDNLIKFYTD